MLGELWGREQDWGKGERSVSITNKCPGVYLNGLSVDTGPVGPGHVFPLTMEADQSRASCPPLCQPPSQAPQVFLQNPLVSTATPDALGLMGFSDPAWICHHSQASEGPLRPAAPATPSRWLWRTQTQLFLTPRTSHKNSKSLLCAGSNRQGDLEHASSPGLQTSSAKHS